LCGTAAAASIDTTILEQPWPRQWVHEYEVGRYPVRWRQSAGKAQGILAGVRFEAPLGREAVWGLTTHYADVGQMVPGVRAVRILQEGPNRKVIQVDVKVLWKELQLSFEVEHEPPRAIRFRLTNEALGEFRGLTVLEERPAAGPGQPASTVVELSTWLRPARPVPVKLLLLVERMSLLQGARRFLESCEPQRRTSLDSVHSTSLSTESRAKSRDSASPRSGRPRASPAYGGASRGVVDTSRPSC
jgi:hypothetical protein